MITRYKQMKIVLFGDSITDAGRNRGSDFNLADYGFGYPSFIAGELLSKDNTYQIYNRGISGDRVVDLYARIKKDVWNLQPDVLSIHIGINDVWHEIEAKNGVEIERFDRIYRMLIKDTKEKSPNVKILLMEPFLLNNGKIEEWYFDRLNEVKAYAKVVKTIADECGCIYLPLQEMLDKAAERFGAEHILPDCVHPSIAGAKLIADAWVKIFNEKIKNK